MVKAIIFDFSRVLLFPKDNSYRGSLNQLHRELGAQPGYNPLEYFELDTETLEALYKLRGKVKLYIYTSESIQDDPALRPNLDKVFDDVFSAKQLGLDKKNPESYQVLSRRIGMLPSEIAYFDDSLPNIAAAKKVGMDAVLYLDNEQLRVELSRLIRG